MTGDPYLGWVRLKARGSSPSRDSARWYRAVLQWNARNAANRLVTTRICIVSVVNPPTYLALAAKMNIDGFAAAVAWALCTP